MRRRRWLARGRRRTLLAGARRDRRAGVLMGPTSLALARGRRRTLLAGARRDRRAGLLMGPISLEDSLRYPFVAPRAGPARSCIGAARVASGRLLSLLLSGRGWVLGQAVVLAAALVSA